MPLDRAHVDEADGVRRLALAQRDTRRYDGFEILKSDGKQKIHKLTNGLLEYKA